VNRFAGTIAAITLFAAYASLPARTPAAPSSKSSSVQAPPVVDMKAEMARMDGQMTKRQVQHGRMMSAMTPEDRWKWMDEQRRSIQESMAMMTRMLQDSRMTGVEILRARASR